MILILWTFGKTGILTRYSLLGVQMCLEVELIIFWLLAISANMLKTVVYSMAIEVTIQLQSQVLEGQFLGEDQGSGR